VRAVLDDGVEVGADARVGSNGAGDDAIAVVGLGAHVDAGERLAAGATRDAAPLAEEPR